MTCIRREAPVPFPRWQTREPQQPPAVSGDSHPQAGCPHNVTSPAGTLRTQWFCACPPVRGVGSLCTAPAPCWLLLCTGEALAAARFEGTGSPDWAHCHGPTKNLFQLTQITTISWFDNCTFSDQRQLCLERLGLKWASSYYTATQGRRNTVTV